MRAFKFFSCSSHFVKYLFLLLYKFLYLPTFKNDLQILIKTLFLRKNITMQISLCRQDKAHGWIQTSHLTSAKFCLKASISFLNIHKVSWKSKILAHGHVRIFLNFVTFPLIVLIKIVQVFKNIVFETEFVIKNKPPFKKENSYA